MFKTKTIMTQITPNIKDLSLKQIHEKNSDYCDRAGTILHQIMNKTDEYWELVEKMLQLQSEIDRRLEVAGTK